MYKNRYENELKHYGVIGMKWGHHKIDTYKAKINKYKNAENAQLSLSKSHAQKGNVRKAESAKNKAEKNKFKQQVNKDRLEGQIAKNKATRDVQRVYEQRTKGAQLATNLIAGPFANRTYNSLRASGTGRAASMAVTIINGALFGAVGHVVVGEIIKNDYAEKKYLNK